MTSIVYIILSLLTAEEIVNTIIFTMNVILKCVYIYNKYQISVGYNIVYMLHNTDHTHKIIIHYCLIIECFVINNFNTHAYE